MSEVKFKQAIILRSDLKMSPGKAAAQASHAAVSAAEKARIRHRDWFEGWKLMGQRKIVLKVKSQADLLELKRKTAGARIQFALISDQGLTELPPGTVTALGIGPAPSNIVDRITGDLALY